MPIKLVIAIRDGWKQQDNKRFGQCLEIRFINTANDKIMFRYAPLLQDKQVWDNFFNILHEYDKKHKEIYSLVSNIEGFTNYSFGECKEVENVSNGNN